MKDGAGVDAVLDFQAVGELQSASSRRERERERERKRERGR